MATATVAAIISATAATASAVDTSMKADKAADIEEKRIGAAKKEALGKRKTLIDTQRKQLNLSGGGFDINKTAPTGIANQQQELLG